MLSALGKIRPTHHSGANELSRMEVKSSNMHLLFEAPVTGFDDARMANAFGPDRASIPEGKIELRASGTMGVDVGESVCEGSGNGRRVEVLLKTKVVFGKEVVGWSKIESGGGGGGFGKKRNEKIQTPLVSGRFREGPRTRSIPG
jgi:hypothetical protein